VTFASRSTSASERGSPGWHRHLAIVVQGKLRTHVELRLDGSLRPNADICGRRPQTSEATPHQS
jgi:hypothetical protein